jgi:hypothetical protein
MMSAELAVHGRAVADYVVDPELDATLAPRPYLHPIRTLRGVVVTDALPADHRWHLGASLAVQDVAGTNLWGGRTYVRDTGYTWRADHGRIVHADWLDRAEDRVVHRLRWLDRDGGELLEEERSIRAVPLPGQVDAWALDFGYSLAAPADREIVLGSPATNGRPGGAGYGGFFWRAAPGLTPPRVFTAAADGEEAVNGSVDPWVALVSQSAPGVAYTLVFTGLGAGDRWFARSEMYPGVCVAFAFDRPRVLGAGERLSGRHVVAVADGALDRPSVAELVTLVGG